MMPSVINGVPQLVDMFKDSDWNIRQAAVETFGQVAWRSQKLLLEPQETTDLHIKPLQVIVQNAIPRLLNVLNDDDSDVIESVVKVFGELTEYGPLSVDLRANN
jgi:hypothetical protein